MLKTVIRKALNYELPCKLDGKLEGNDDGPTYSTGKACHMTRRDMLTSIAVGTILPQVAGCEMLGLQWRYRYRLIGEVQRGNQIYRGSSVIEVIRDKGYNGIGGRAHGEAAVVDIPNANSLFLLLRDNHDGSPDWPFRMPHKAFVAELGSPNMVDPELLDKLVDLPVGTTSVLMPDQYPTMVRFRDTSDPKSAELIDPGNLGASFGRGVSAIMYFT